MNATERPVSISICYDCLALLANGELGGYDPDGKLAREHAAMMNAEWPNTEITLGTVGHDEDDDEGHFSWSACQGCGSPLGGDRFPATAWIPEEG